MHGFYGLLGRFARQQDSTGSTVVHGTGAGTGTRYRYTAVGTGSTIVTL